MAAIVEHRRVHECDVGGLQRQELECLIGVQRHADRAAAPVLLEQVRDTLAMKAIVPDHEDVEQRG
jgi:hypothetical protein